MENANNFVVIQHTELSTHNSHITHPSTTEIVDNKNRVNEGDANDNLGHAEMDITGRNSSDLADHQDAINKNIGTLKEEKGSKEFLDNAILVDPSSDKVRTFDSAKVEPPAGPISSNVIPSAELFGNKVVPTAEFLGNKVDPSTELFGNKVDPAAELLGNKVDPSTDLLGNKVDPTAEVIENKVDSTAEVLGNKVDPTAELLDNKVDPSTELLGNNIDPTAEFLGNKVDPSTDLLGNKVDPSTELFGNKVDPAAELLGNKVDPSTDLLGNKVDPTAEVIENKVDSTAEVLGNKVDPTAELLDNKVDPSTELLGNNIDPTAEFLGNKVDPSTDLLGNKVDPTAELLDNKVDPAAELLDNKVDPSLEYVGKGVETISGLKRDENMDRIEVIEEFVVASKATGKTGEDDNLIEEWRKAEANVGKKENKDTIPEDKDSKEAIESRLIGEMVVDLKESETREEGLKTDAESRLMDEILGNWEAYDAKEVNKPESSTECKKEESKAVNEAELSVNTDPDTSSPNTGTKKKKSSGKRVVKTLKVGLHSAAKTLSKLDIQTAEERRKKIEERMKKKEEKLSKEKCDMKKHQQQLAVAMKRLLPEEANDSGVDENTQSKETNEHPPVKNGKVSQVKKQRQPRSVDPSPMKPRTPQSATSLERSLPMNKIEVGKSASPNIKNVRSKIGSLDNSTYKPGGGKVKIESKKLDFSKASSRVTAKNDTYSPGGGDKKIESQKLKWNANSKIGSLEKKDYKPGGGDKTIQTQKLNFKEKAHSKVGSKDNLKHKAGGGDIEIQVEKLDFKAKASSKVGSLDNVKHKAGGGEKKIYDDKEYLRQTQATASNPASGRASGAISPATTGTNSPGPQEEEESQSQKEEE